ncbi:hypothetical protein A0H81_05071 [Grifola frondosa]|uniref:Uncharacterized protein n=1 Tax=Grifola frondosa TaxID=5627 RepID=A0A1C7MHX9_GRIFR|nr:hypothetical protein A0H81_05071 [Grifola frondosa]
MGQASSHLAAHPPRLKKQLKGQMDPATIHQPQRDPDITRVAFPPGTHGFLYYWSPPRVPLAGAVRFRITKDSEPESFDQGSDLRVRNGTLPWQIPLLVAAAPSAQYRHLSKMLQRDGLVSPALLEQCRELTREHGVNVQSTLLCAFGQPFLVSFAQQSTQLVVLGEDALFRVLYPLPFTDFRHFQPYTGQSCPFAAPYSRGRSLAGPFV